MKIFIVNTLYRPNEIGGAEISTRTVAEELVARGHQVVAASIAPDGQVRQDTVNGVRCYYLKLANIYWPHTLGFKPALWQKILWHAIDVFNPIMATRLGELLDREKPDVAHMHNLQGFSISAWWAADRRKIPIVQTVHDYYLACPNSVMYRRSANCTAPCVKCRFFRLPSRLLSHLPTVVTGVSNRMLSRLEHRGLFAEVAHTQVIYGCNLDRHALSPRVQTPERGPLRFGFFGRIEPLKGLETLLKAMRRLPDASARLVIGGRGAPEYIARLQKDYGAENITFLGYTGPAEFYSQIDILIVPSLWEEPLGRIAHEAFAYGIPVYASRIGGLPEVIEPGLTGELFSPGNVDELARLMQSAVQQGLPSATLTANALKSAEKYSREIITDHYEQALMTAVCTRRPPIKENAAS